LRRARAGPSCPPLPFGFHLRQLSSQGLALGLGEFPIPWGGQPLDGRGFLFLLPVLVFDFFLFVNVSG